MKNIYKYFVLILLMFFPIKPLFSQWIKTNGPDSGSVNSLVVHTIAGDSILFAGTSTGVFRTSDYGQTWKPFNSGLPDRHYKRVYVLLSTDSTLFAGTFDGIFSVADNEKTWSAPLDSPDDIKAMAVMGSDIFASQGLSRDVPGIFMSADNGRSWVIIRGGEGGRIGQFYPSLAVLDTFLIAGSANSQYYGVVLLYNNGNRWAVYDTSLNPNTDVYSLAAYGGKIFAGTGSGVFYSNDYGAHWTKRGLKGYHISSLHILKNNLFAIADSSKYELAYGGLYYSDNNGLDWTKTELRGKDISSYLIFHGYIFAGTTTGEVWRRPLSEIITSIDEGMDNLPNHFKLGQNYPNPFNPTTRIRYSVPEKSYVSLKVYNLLGQKVETLFKGFRQPGNYEVTFNGEGLASGIYLYRLKANNFEQTEKLLLIK